MTGSLPPSFFEQLYAADADPWGFERRWYEQRKYACTLAALPEPRYRRGFEPGCSVGVLSAALAQRCESLVCWDVTDEPLRSARRRLSHLPGVRVEHGAVPHEWPPGRFDLIVISEVAYYLNDADRRLLWDAATDALEPGGTLLTVHWRHPVAEYPVTGDTVHEELGARSGLARIVEHVEADFRLDVHQRTPPAARSVAERTGLR